jgi:hypothetical protein
MKFILGAAFALLVAGCVDTTASIDIARVESPIRKSCPAFREGSFMADAARTYGAEQITNFRNTSRVTCRCIVKDRAQTPSCAQVAQYGRIPNEP